jgi:hypothetical protein
MGAVKAGAHIYMTVEEIDDAAIDVAFAAAQSADSPAVRGELIEGDTGGYHFYPGRDRVRSWLAYQRLDIVAQADDPLDSWGYWHLLLRTPST